MSYPVVVVKFDELFDRNTITKDRKVGNTYEVLDKPSLIVIQGWLTMDNHSSFYVRPRQRLVKAVTETMIQINYDKIYFKCYDDGDEVRVFSQYNQIIGSRHLFTVKKEDWI